MDILLTHIQQYLEVSNLKFSASYTMGKVILKHGLHTEALASQQFWKLYSLTLVLAPFKFAAYFSCSLHGGYTGFLIKAYLVSLAGTSQRSRAEDHGSSGKCSDIKQSWRIQLSVTGLPFPFWCFIHNLLYFLYENCYMTCLVYLSFVKNSLFRQRKLTINMQLLVRSYSTKKKQK